MQKLFIFSFAAFLLSLLSVWTVRSLARKYGWLAPVKKDRWHTKPTALYGGVGIFFAFIVTAIVLFWQSSSSLSHVQNLKIIALLVGATGSFVLGFVDDIFHLKPVTKLISQIAVTTFFIYFGASFDITPWQVLNIVLTYFWFIGIMNAVNLLDNMDGLSSGIVMISAIVLFALTSIAQQNFYQFPQILTLVFFASILGFWMFNKYPGTIFMGDCGSLFLGYVLAVLALPNSFVDYTQSFSYSSLLSFLMPVTVLAIPIFDTSLVTIIRKFSGRAVSQGGRDHTSHRLVGLGFSERLAVVILYALSFIGGVAAVLMAYFPDHFLIIFGLYFTFLIIIGLYLGKIKVYPKSEAQKQHSGWTPIVAQILYKKGRIEILIDMAMIAIAYYGSFSVFHQSNGFILNEDFRLTIPIVIFVTVFLFYVSGMYKGLWSLVSVEDLSTFFRSVFFSLVGVILINTFLFGIQFVWPAYLFYGLLVFSVIVGSRLSFRYFDALVGNYKISQRPIKILLYGAGTAGKIVLDEIKRNKIYDQIQPIGFLDDDPNKIGKSISGIKIFGDIANFYKNQNKKNFEFEEIWISSPKIQDDRVMQLKDLIIKKQDVSIRRLNLQFVTVNHQTHQIHPQYPKQ